MPETKARKDNDIRSLNIVLKELRKANTTLSADLVFNSRMKNLEVYVASIKSTIKAVGATISIIWLIVGTIVINKFQHIDETIENAALLQYKVEVLEKVVEMIVKDNHED